MKASDQIFLTFRHLYGSLSMLSKMKIRWIYLIPVILQILFILTGISLSGEIHQMVQDLLADFQKKMVSDYNVPAYLFSATSFVTYIIIRLMLFIVFAIAGTYLMLILLSPVYSWLSEKTESFHTGKQFPFRLKVFLRDIFRAILINIRNGLIQFLLVILLFILSFVPVLNLFTAMLLFIVSAYYYGFSFLDYSFERYGLKMKESFQRVRKMKIAAVIIGSVFLVVYMIPWIGPFLAAILSFHLVIASTMLVMEVKGKLANQSSEG